MERKTFLKRRKMESRGSREKSREKSLILSDGKNDPI